jgi:hypothetical protein
MLSQMKKRSGHAAGVYPSPADPSSARIGFDICSHTFQCGHRLTSIICFVRLKQLLGFPVSFNVFFSPFFFIGNSIAPVFRFTIKDACLPILKRMAPITATNIFVWIA